LLLNLYQALNILQFIARQVDPRPFRAEFHIFLRDGSAKHAQLDPQLVAGILAKPGCVYG